MNSSSMVKYISSNYARFDFIDYKTAYFINVIILQQIVKLTLRVFGIVTNILALIVFCKTGVGDGIAVSFLSITVSDLIFLSTFVVATFLGLLDLNFHVKPYVSLYWVSYILPFYGLMFYNISTLQTVFLAVQKCCCVAMPISFKDQFSRGRCLVITTCIYCGTMVTYIPFTVSVLPFQPVFDSATNSTRLIFIFTPNFLNQIFPVLKGISYICIPIVSEVIVLHCTILLIVKLSQSLRFRNLTHTPKINAHRNKKSLTETHVSLVKSQSGVLHSCDANKMTVRKSPKETPNKQHRNSNISPDMSEATHTLAFTAKEQDRVPTEVKETITTKNVQKNAFKKELRLTQAVTVVTSIFVVLNSPNIVIFFTSLVVPQFSGFGDYGNTYAMCMEINDLLNVINASMNLFVYLKYNFRFKQTFSLMFNRF